MSIDNEKVLHELILENITTFIKRIRYQIFFIDSEYKIKKILHK